MDKNEINEALNELSGHVAGMARAIGSERNAHDLEIIANSLIRSAGELDSIVNVMIDQQL